MKPRVPITDAAFKWTPAVNTDIRKTFARVRAEQRKAELAAQPIPPEHRVIQLRGK